MIRLRYHDAFNYCKTLYFRCILISRFWNVEISLHFNLAFSQAFDRQTGFLQVFNFTILSYSRNSRKFDAREKYVFYSMTEVIEITICVWYDEKLACQFFARVELHRMKEGTRDTL